MSGSRARVSGARGTKRPVTNVPSPAEQRRLAASLGALLRRLRAEADIGTRGLARRASCARVTIKRLEAGERRPRRSLLAALAYGLCPDDPAPITEALVAAAGKSLVPESPWSERRRRRAMDRAVLSGAAPLPDRIGDPLALHQKADELYQRALSILDEPGAYDDGDKLAEVDRLMALSRSLADRAGPPITLHVGGRAIRAGFRHP